MDCTLHRIRDMQAAGGREQNVPMGRLHIWHWRSNKHD
jgi:hypothetical protein